MPIERNQCDGCQAGIPVQVNAFGSKVHLMKNNGYYDYMSCQREKYVEGYDNEMARQSSKSPSDSP